MMTVTPTEATTRDFRHFLLLVEPGFFFSPCPWCSWLSPFISCSRMKRGPFPLSIQCRWCQEQRKQQLLLHRCMSSSALSPSPLPSPSFHTKSRCQGGRDPYWFTKRRFVVHGGECRRSDERQKDHTVRTLAMMPLQQSQGHALKYAHRQSAAYVCSSFRLHTCTMSLSLQLTLKSLCGTSASTLVCTQSWA